MSAITEKTAIEHTETISLPRHGIRDRVLRAGRFIWHLLEMLVAMQVGMSLFHLLLGLLRIFSRVTAWESGTMLHAIAMTVFMTVPMVAWMIFRGHGWRHSAEMVIAMIAPMALIGLLCQLGVDEYLPWLAGLSFPAMLLGMIAAMLYRRDHYTRAKSHAVDHAKVGLGAAHH